MGFFHKDPQHAIKHFEKKVQSTAKSIIKHAENISSKNHKLNEPKILLFKHAIKRMQLPSDHLIEIRTELAKNLPKQRRLFHAVKENIEQIEQWVIKNQARDAIGEMGDIVKNIRSSCKTIYDWIGQLIILYEKQETIIAKGDILWVENFLKLFDEERKLYKSFQRERESWAREFAKFGEKIHKLPSLNPKEYSGYKIIIHTMEIFFFAVYIGMGVYVFDAKDFDDLRARGVAWILSLVPFTAAVAADAYMDEILSELDYHLVVLKKLDSGI